MQKRIAILGCTGSIGIQAVRLIESFPGEMEVVALGAGRNVGLVREQAERLRPRLVSVASEEDAEGLRSSLSPLGIEVVSGEEGAIRVATCSEAGIVLAAMVGTAGIRPTLRALEAGKDVALANKEALVSAGDVLTAAARRSGAQILPVDSEHSAIHQCLRAGAPGEIHRLILTASGGPFLEWPIERLETATPEEALRHPRWEMGPKITVDSATLMNKGLEVIEAHRLFGLPSERIDVVVHPQAAVHSLVEFRDGSLLAQLSATDMTLPIQYALTWPGRWDRRQPSLDLVAIGRLEFRLPEPARFPCLRLARAALEAGGGAPAILNAANEEAVRAFLERRIRFTAIPQVIEEALRSLPSGGAADLDSLLDLDRRARESARLAIGSRALL